MVSVRVMEIVNRLSTDVKHHKNVLNDGEFEFSNFKRDLNLKYEVYFQNSMTKCNHLNHFIS